MARKVFPQDRLVNRVPTTSGLPITNYGANSLTVYTDAAGTLLADIQTYPGGVTIAGSVITCDAQGTMPLFLGPDGVDDLYVLPVGGAVQAIYARYDDRVDTLETTVAAHAVAADPHTQYLLASGARAVSGSLAIGGGLQVQGSVDGYNANVQFDKTAADAIVGLSSNSTGSPSMLFDHRATGNTGKWQWRNGTSGTNTNMELQTGGNLKAVGVDHSFGANALSGSGTQVNLGSFGDAAAAYVMGRGSAANVALILRSKGTSGVALQGGANLVGLTVADNGAAATLGFYATSPIVKPTVTGSRGANAALASLLTQLAALGLLVDSSS